MLPTHHQNLRLLCKQTGNLDFLLHLLGLSKLDRDHEGEPTMQPNIMVSNIT